MLKRILVLLSLADVCTGAAEADSTCFTSGEQNESTKTLDKRALLQHSKGVKLSAHGHGHSSKDWYRKVAGGSDWGGKCRCPSGGEYEVGDNGDQCASLMCDDGEKMDCAQGSIDPKNFGAKVSCDAPNPHAYRKMAGVNLGSFGGTCTCPDGSMYRVGHLGQNCTRDTLACENGVPSDCDPDHVPKDYYGWGMTCSGKWVDQYFMMDLKPKPKRTSGGTCTCPSGVIYEVGDNDDNCSSLACEHGHSGGCLAEGITVLNHGMKVVCAPSVGEQLAQQSMEVADAAIGAWLGNLRPAIAKFPSTSAAP